MVDSELNHPVGKVDVNLSKSIVPTTPDRGPSVKKQPAADFSEGASLQGGMWWRGKLSYRKSV